MKLRFHVTGMTCAACAARVEKVAKAVPGVEKAEVNLMGGTMTVEAASGSVKDAILQAVAKAGYGTSVAGEKLPETKSTDTGMREIKIRIIGSAVFLVILMYFTMGHMIGLPVPHWYHGVENALVAALLQLFRSMLWMGKNLLGASVDPETPITINFDDSYITDSQTRRAQDKDDALSGFIPKYRYNMEWRGMSEAQAKAAVQEAMRALHRASNASKCGRPLSGTGSRWCT